MNAIVMNLDVYLVAANLLKSRHAIVVGKGFSVVFFDENLFGRGSPISGRLPCWSLKKKE